MTTAQVASESGSCNHPLGVARILDLCDRILGELGRRQHLFAWLRAPDAGREEWLTVDAYYPSNQLLVVWHEQPGPDDHVYSELVPERGLRLLELTPIDVDGDLEQAELALRRRIAALGPAPRRAAEPAPPEPAREVATPAQTVALAVVPTQGAGLVLGIALAVVLLIETYAGVVNAGLDGGHLLLAFGLSLDVCARALGTMAAVRAGNPEWAWWCAIGGSPVVAAFAAAARQGPTRPEPAPLAGVISCVALAALAAQVLAAAL